MREACVQGFHTSGRLEQLSEVRQMRYELLGCSCHLAVPPHVSRVYSPLHRRTGRRYCGTWKRVDEVRVAVASAHMDCFACCGDDSDDAHHGGLLCARRHRVGPLRLEVVWLDTTATSKSFFQNRYQLHMLVWSDTTGTLVVGDELLVRHVSELSEYGKEL